jgi:hypothetical protein
MLPLCRFRNPLVLILIQAHLKNLSALVLLSLFWPSRRFLHERTMATDLFGVNTINI